MRAGPEPEMVDLSFALEGGALAADYAHALWAALGRVLPWLAEEPGIGVHPLRGALTADGELLLAKRSRLVLRLPSARVDAAHRLEGVALDVAGRRVGIGAARQRALEPADTLHAHLVASGTADEAAFSAELTACLARMDAPCRFICGRRHRFWAGGRAVEGHSVVLHGVPAAASLRLQALGLGPERGLGCGILVPHKTIGGLD